MSFLSNAGRAAAGYSTGGLSELYRAANGGTDSTTPRPWNPITANTVKIAPSLAGTMGGIGTAAVGNIGANYAGAKKKQAQEGAVRGQLPGANSYGAERLAKTQGLDTGNLESALGGQIGETAYNDALSNRDYGQSLDLADQIAKLNKPNLLQQIFQGIGSVGKPIAQYGGMGGFKNRGGGGGGSPSDFTGLV